MEKPTFDLPFCIQNYYHEGKLSFTNSYDLRNVFMIKGNEDGSCGIYRDTADMGMTIYCTAQELREQMKNLELYSVKKLELEKDDIITVSTDKRVSDELLTRIKDIFKSELSIPNKIIFLENMGLNIVKKKN